MLPSKVVVRLNPSDIRVLLELAQREYRDPRAQAAILIREALEKRGLLSPEDCQTFSEELQSKGVSSGNG